MADSRLLPTVTGALLCLGFTGGDVAWASPARRDWIEDPFAPHDARGTTARLGTSVGFLRGEPVEATALGLAAGAGRRVGPAGRLALEAEYGYLGFQERGPSSLRLGHGHRAGVIARYDVARLGPRVVGGNSMLALYVEGGAGVAWNRWARTAYDEMTRLVPADTRRVEGQLGFGIAIDHRLQEPIGFPRRIGWFLGWRTALSPAAAEPGFVCRGSSCRPAPAPTTSEPRYIDRAMLFQSSLAFTW